MSTPKNEFHVRKFRKVPPITATCVGCVQVNRLVRQDQVTPEGYTELHMQGQAPAIKWDSRDILFWLGTRRGSVRSGKSPVTCGLFVRWSAEPSWAIPELS